MTFQAKTRPLVAIMIIVGAYPVKHKPFSSILDQSIL
jgi:hypothetical protein